MNDVIGLLTSAKHALRDKFTAHLASHPGMSHELHPREHCKAAAWIKSTRHLYIFDFYVKMPVS
jgi:hypothetical protein